MTSEPTTSSPRTRVTNFVFSEIQTGDTAEFSHTVSNHDIRLFAAASGDNNPVHLDPHYGEQSRFGHNIMHGMYSGALISRMLGTQFPGPGTIYLSQNLSFRFPVSAGDTLTVRVEVTALHPKKPVVTLACTVTNQDGTVVTTGESVVLAPTEKETLELPPLPEMREQQE